MKIGVYQCFNCYRRWGVRVNPPSGDPLCHYCESDDTSRLYKYTTDQVK